MSKISSTRPSVSAFDLKRRFEYAQSTYSPSAVKESIELNRLALEESSMSDVTREEVKARLEASEARVSTVVEAMRSDAAELRSELHTGLEQIRSQGVIAQANADKFYAQAGALLADSKTLLAEIRQAGEKNRADVMSMGYKALTWLFGAVLALCGLYFTIKKAVEAPRAPAMTSAQSQPPPQPTPSSQAQTSASSQVQTSAPPQPPPPATRP